MNGEGFAFGAGFVCGIAIAIFASAIYWNELEDACALKHDVYECDWIYIPKEAENDSIL